METITYTITFLGIYFLMLYIGLTAISLLLVFLVNILTFLKKSVKYLIDWNKNRRKQNAY